MPTPTALATEAYIYYYPLVENLTQVRRFVEHGMGQNPAAAYNVFSHARRLATDKDTFVTINNDTLYSMAQCDLSSGPIVLTVPPIDRYHVLQFVDAWTDNFAYVGTRSQGSDGGTYLIVPPGYEGEVPEGMTSITAPTDIFSIVGRISCAGEHDLPAVHSLQEGLQLATLWEAVAPASGVIDPGPASDDLLFWEKARAWSLAYPPSMADQAGQESYVTLGLTSSDAPFAQPSDGVREALTAGMAAGKERLEDLGRHPDIPVNNGWGVGVHSFDYNVSFFELGTLDDPAWTITSPAERFTVRALATRLGLWGNHGYEAVYAQAFTDATGEALHGSSSYTITLPSDPPVDAFWSITLYSVPDYFLVANHAHRYSVGDRTPGIVRGDDGSLEIRVAHEEPTDAVQRANWLPAPAEAFRLVFRLYAPRPEVLDGSWGFPPITRV